MILSNFKINKEIKYFLADNKLLNINTLPKKDRNLGKLSKLGKIISVHLTSGKVDSRELSLHFIFSFKESTSDYNSYATHLKLIDTKCSINTYNVLTRNEFILCLCKVILSYQQHWLNSSQSLKLNNIYDNYLSSKDTDINSIGSALFVKEILENKSWK